MSGGSVPYSTNPAGYNPTTSFAYEPTHQVPSQPGMSRRPSNATVAWNESDSSYQSTPINSVLHPQSHQSAPEQGLNHPPRLHFTVQVPGNQSHSLLESSNSGGINGAPGPGSPMSASPSYQTHLSGNLPQDQSLGSHYLSNRSPQMSPRNSQSHSNLQQHQLGTPSAGGMNAYYGDPGSGSAAPASAIPRVLTYSPSQYALRPHNSSINNSHSSPSANTPKTNPSSASITTSGSLLPQHHSIQLGLFSSSQVNPNVAYSNQSSALPPPPAYATISPGNPPYYSHHNHSIPLASSNSMATNLPPLSSFLNSATSLRPNAIQSGSQSSSQAPQTEHYYGSRSASGASSHRPRRATEDIGFRRIIQGAVDLRPVIHNPPSERRLDPINGGYISPLKALTIHLASTYRLINPNFRYELSLNPRRVLTKPSKPAGNNGMDNEDSDYILYVNDILGGSSSGDSNSELAEAAASRGGSGGGHKYLILDVLGQGTFGQVVKCQDMKTHEVVAVKVVKNKQAYFSQSMMEVTILELLNNTWDAENKHHILRMKDTFIHQNHLCLVFELLSSNLYELIKQNSFRGLSTSLVRVFTNQLLDALTVLNEAHLIHCDLKPENILLTSLSSPEIKVIDFGSACHERQTVYTYIQSRFYRSPEVILGLPYSSAIDMWSLGCICVELFLGLPLFPGTSEYNQISRIIEMLGTPPTYMLEVGKQTLQFFDVVDDFEGGRKTYTLKSIDQYSKEHHVQEQPSKRYFAQNTLEDIISQYPVLRKGLKPADLEKEKQNRIAFIDFVKGLLNINPIERWSPQQARLHPFILGEPLREPYVPMKSSYQSGIGGASTKLSETKPKSLGHSSQAQADNQARSQPVNNSKGIIAGMGVSEASIKRPYGGLPAAPARSGQKVYDAAAYSQLQAQQQAINAQAAAIRQQQAQAAQQSHNPYVISHDNRSNVVSQTQSSSQTQTQNHSTNSANLLHHQFSGRLSTAHNPHPSNIGSMPPSAISIPHSFYNARGGPMSGPLTAGSLPSSNLSTIAHNQLPYNPQLGHSGGIGNGGSNIGNAVLIGRQRSGTLDQMDLVPPQLARVQSDLTNYAGQSVTPILRRDDQYLAWEQRQHSGVAGTIGVGGNLSRRPSHRTNPQLDYLHEQAESGDGWGFSQRQPRYGHYQPTTNSSTYYSPTSHVPSIPTHHSRVLPSQNKPSHQSFSVIVEGEDRKSSHEKIQDSSNDHLSYDPVSLDTYDHRDGGQAMAYLPMVPKPSCSGQPSSSGSGSGSYLAGDQVAALALGNGQTRGRGF